MPDIHDLLKFSADTAEADFLFEEDISKYLNEIYTHGVDLHTVKPSIGISFSPLPPDMTIRRSWMR